MRSPTVRLVTSAIKFSARFEARRGRTSRSPRMSCSPTTAASAVSKPDSSPRTASTTSDFGRARAPGQLPTSARFTRPRSATPCTIPSPPPLEVVFDLNQPFLARVFVERLQDHRRLGHIIEQSVELFVKQWQPVLHAGIAAPLADRLIELIIAIRRPEGLDVCKAEPPDS